jgi:hypothetical protein
MEIPGTVDSGRQRAAIHVNSMPGPASPERKRHGLIPIRHDGSMNGGRRPGGLCGAGRAFVTQTRPAKLLAFRPQKGDKT